MNILGRLKKLITPKTGVSETYQIARDIWSEAEHEGISPEDFRDDFIHAFEQLLTRNYGSQIMTKLSDELNVPGLRVRAKRSDARGPGSRGGQPTDPVDKIGTVLSIVGQMTKSEKKRLMSALIDLI